MGRRKTGLEYYSQDVTWDKKVIIFKAKYGLTGVGFLVSLYQEIYKEGYYCKWGEDEKLLFCAENRIEDSQFIDMLNFAFNKDIFSKELYDKYKILSSSGIQKRYIDASVKRTSISLTKEYLLIKPDVPAWSKLKIDINSKEPDLFENNLDSKNIVVESETVVPEPETVDLDSGEPQKKRNESKGKERSKREIDSEESESPHQDFIDEILALFCEEYEKNMEMPFEIMNKGKERKAIGKLLGFYKQKNKASPKSAEETKNDMRIYFEACVQIQESWYRDNMTPALIVSKFQEINTILKNERKNGSKGGINTGRKSAATAEGILNSLNKHFNLTSTEGDHG